jgi:anti-sigma factor RsiW
MKNHDHRTDADRGFSALPNVRSSSQQHLAPAQMSLCRDGGLKPREAAAVRAHLRSCARCRAADAKVFEVRQILRHQASQTLPATIAMRIDRALVDEVAQGMWPPAPRRPLPSS